jgi:hypothetical protein
MERCNLVISVLDKLPVGKPVISAIRESVMKRKVVLLFYKLNNTL